MADKKYIYNSLMKVLEYSRCRNYAGYSKFDALNAPFLEKICGSNYICRLLVTQLVNRVPFNLRPISGVNKTRNPKGIANFIKVYCNMYSINPAAEYLDEVNSLSDWLLENHSNKENRYHGICWGYNFPWQSPGFYAPRFFPNCIVTVFCADALLYAYEVTKNNKYLQAAESAADFILKDLPVMEENEAGKCIGYVPAGVNWKVININAVAAGFLSHLFGITKKEGYIKEAKCLINWVISRKTGYYAWHYTYPKSSSGIGHDNYHTGGILDGILDYMTYSEDYSYLEVCLKALKFYEENLFKSDGAPKLTDRKEFPYDIHGAAQGILTFTKASCLNPSHLDFAGNIADWGIRFMQAEDGHFYYRKYRFFVLKYCLMRWNNSWMAWALSELILRLNKC